jgi:Ca-activated chloride channel family protein
MSIAVPRHPDPGDRYSSIFIHLAPFIRILLLATLLLCAARVARGDGQQLLLDRDAPADAIQLLGVVEMTVKAPFEPARVTLAMDGQVVAQSLRSPYRVFVDLGPTAIEHKIVVTAFTADWKKVSWTQTINRGMESLRVRLKLIDLAGRTYEAFVTTPESNPVRHVEFWSESTMLGRVDRPPYRMNVTPEQMSGLVHVTAKTASGDEADDFVLNNEDIHVESLEVRTVPLFVSVIDGKGATLDNLERAAFRIMDNGAEAKIVDFAPAFNQPISLALLVDASDSMLYELPNAARSASAFAEKVLRDRDRCSLFSIRSVPRRELALTGNKAQVEQALTLLRTSGRTALYDSIGSAIRELRNEQNRRAIVVLTDGGDTSSVSTYSEVEALAKVAGIPIYFIAFGMESEFGTDLEKMKYLAGETGGFVAQASADNLPQKYAAIEKDLRAQYAIRYQVTDLTRHNEWRQVRVVLNSPKLVARTIKGYFAP